MSLFLLLGENYQVLNFSKANLLFLLSTVGYAAELNLIPAGLFAACCWLRRPGMREAGYYILIGIIGIDATIYRVFGCHYALAMAGVAGQLDNQMFIPSAGTVLGFLLLLFACMMLVNQLCRAGNWLAARCIKLVIGAHMGLLAVMALSIGCVQFNTFSSVRLRSLAALSFYPDFGSTQSPLTSKRFAVTNLAVVTEQPPLVSTNATPPDIFILMADSIRYDALTEFHMPNTYRRVAQRGQLLFRHFSTGNATSIGVPGVLAGLSVNYLRVLEGAQLPFRVFLDRYQYAKVASCASAITYAGLRSGLFSQCTNVADSWKCAFHDRDQRAADYLLEKYRARNPAKPFFAWLFLDSSHSPYEYEAQDSFGTAPQVPGKINYAKVLFSFPVSVYRDQYFSSAHYVDRIIGQVLDAIDASARRENTIIVVVGDHGEEFFEIHHFGHLSALNRYQLQTMAAIWYPGIEPGTISNLTSHVDLLPTILLHCGVTNELPRYFSGQPIQKDHSRMAAIVGGSAGPLGVVHEDVVSELKYGDVITYTLDEKPLDDAHDARNWCAAKLLEVMNQDFDRSLGLRSPTAPP